MRPRRHDAALLRGHSTSPLGVTELMRRRRPSRCKFHGWLAGSLLLRCVALLLCAQLVACGTPFDPRASTYAVMTPAQVGTFLGDLSSLAKAHGLTPSVGSATSDGGTTLHVLEARGKFLRLWVQNVPVGPAECGDSTAEASVDPGQFLIAVAPEMSLPLRDRALTLSNALATELRAKGYRILPHPVEPCSKVYLSEGHAK